MPRKKATIEAPAEVTAAVEAEAPAKKTRKRTTKKAAETEAAAPAEEKPAKKTRKKTVKKAAEPAVEETPVVEAAPAVEEAPAAEAAPAPEETPAPAEPEAPAKKKIAFIGSECHPFVKTGGLGDVMYALPIALSEMGCDVRVILPRYECIPQKWQEQMVYKGEFYMDLGQTGREFYVGIMEYVANGVTYDFVDNQEFFSGAKPYTNLVDDIPKYCFFSKASLAILNYMEWTPDIIHCHDWQAGLVPVFLKTLFRNTPVGQAASAITIHNLKFQGIYNIQTFKYWTGLPDEVFTFDGMKQGENDANMLKGGMSFADQITTVSETYAKEIQTAEYGENLETHLQYHSTKLRGIVNGIDCGMWNPATDPTINVHYDVTDAIAKKKEAKAEIQAETGLEVDGSKLLIGLISRLTDQKGLDLVNAIIPSVMDGNTQIVVLGTGDKVYEESFRKYAEEYPGSFAACIQYDEPRAHRIYAGADALLVPSRFEPCGLTQLNAMHYGTLPIVRETGGLKDTVDPYNKYTNEGNGFTFDRYDASLLLDAVNRGKTLFFTEREKWDEMVERDMNKDVSWQNSAKKYMDMYNELKGE